MEIDFRSGAPQTLTSRPITALPCECSIAGNIQQSCGFIKSAGSEDGFQVRHFVGGYSIHTFANLSAAGASAPGCNHARQHCSC